MHPHDRARCLGSFDRELLGRYLRAPGAPYNFDPFVSGTFESRDTRKFAVDAKIDPTIGK